MLLDGQGQCKAPSWAHAEVHAVQSYARLGVHHTKKCTRRCVVAQPMGQVDVCGFGAPRCVQCAAFRAEAGPLEHDGTGRAVVAFDPLPSGLGYVVLANAVGAFAGGQGKLLDLVPLPLITCVGSIALM